MNDTLIHGYWESSPTGGYHYFSSDGRMISFVPTPPDHHPKSTWLTIPYWYRLDGNGSLLLRLLKPDAREQCCRLQWQGEDVVIIRRIDPPSLEWRFQRVPDEDVPKDLEQPLKDAWLNLDKHFAEFEAKQRMEP